MPLWVDEIKKMLGNKKAKVILGIALVYFVFIIFNNVNDIVYVSEDGNEVVGFGAVNKLKVGIKEWEGILDADKIWDVILLNKEVEGNEEYHSEYGLTNEGYYYIQKSYDIRELINRSFSGLQNYDYYTINTISENDAKNFYSNRITSLQVWLEKNEIKNYYSEKEKLYLINQFEKFNSPLQYNYMGSWKFIFENSSAFLFAIAILCCIITSTVFSIEYEQNTASVYYSTVGGKKAGVRSKIIAALLTVSIIYWFVISLFIIVSISIFGTTGAGNYIQTNSNYWFSIYNITNLQATCILSLFGYMGCIFFTTVSLLLSAKTKSSNIAIIFSFLLIMGIGSIGELFQGSLAQKITGLMPGALLSVGKMLNEYNLYQISDNIITQMVLLPVIYIIVITLIIFCIYRVGKAQKI